MQTDINNSISMQNFISEILLHLNISFTSYNDFPQNMSRALKTIGELSHHDKIHIIEVHRNMTYSIQYEWCNEQFLPTSEKYKHAPVIHNIPWVEQLCEQNYIVIRDVSEAPDPAAQTLLQEQDCHQMLILPLFESNSQFAFISFMQCKQIHEWSSEEIHTLIDLASVIATQLNNYYLVGRLLRHVRQLKQEQQPVELIHTHLKQLHAEILPTWNQIKNSNPDFHQQIVGFSELDQQMLTLDHICNTLFEK